MATYAIGDIQGCYEPLQRLLAQIAFDPQRDKLWLAGDLINRGPQSLEVLRWAYSLGDRVTAVLGNHDLHTLGIAAGVRSLRAEDTVGPIFEAYDSHVLLDWLRHCPLVHAEDGYLLFHAGLIPQWSTEEAIDIAHRCEKILQSKDNALLLKAYRKANGMQWHEAQDKGGIIALGAALQILTRLRTCTHDGQIAPEYTGSLAGIPPGTKPWFDFDIRRQSGITCVFGHWAALGLYNAPHAIGLDTGCVWGQQLTAMRLEDRAVFQVSAAP